MWADGDKSPSKDIGVLFGDHASDREPRRILGDLARGGRAVLDTYNERRYFRETRNEHFSSDTAFHEVDQRERERVPKDKSGACSTRMYLGAASRPIQSTEGVVEEKVRARLCPLSRERRVKEEFRYIGGVGQCPSQFFDSAGYELGVDSFTSLVGDPELAADPSRLGRA